MALFTESDCDTLEVELGYSSDIDAALPEQTETIQLEAVEAGEETPLVFGNDDYEYGWVNQVTCLDSTGSRLAVSATATGVWRHPSRRFIVSRGAPIASESRPEMSKMSMWMPVTIASCVVASVLTGCVAMLPSPTSLPRSDDPVALTERLHDRHRQPVLADGAGHPLDVPRDRRRRRRADGRGHGHAETEEIANGITARVVRDTVTDGDEIVEDTFDWYAQDAAGRSGTSARTPPSSKRRDRLARGLVRGRCRRRPARHRHAGVPNRGWDIGRSIPPDGPRTTVRC